MVRVTLSLVLSFLFSVQVAFGAGLETWSYSGYDGPRHWGQITPDWLACERGTQQSPINLSHAFDTHLPALELFWNHTNWRIENTGTTLMLTAEKPGHVMIGNRKFTLEYIDFHSPSEHAIGGQRFPMEVQFVHRTRRGARAAIAVMLRGGGRNDAMEAIMARAPLEMGMDSLVPELDPVQLVSDTGDLLRYRGSDTTPPCDENVEWTVLADPVTISDAAILAFTGLFHENARPLQKRNRRYILMD